MSQCPSSSAINGIVSSFNFTIELFSLVHEVIGQDVLKIFIYVLVIGMVVVMHAMEIQVVH